MAPYVGQRISFDSQPCTVRYIGPVTGTKGDWLGVEWDDPTRGKHGGKHQGGRYFECLSQHPTAGSFVRPNRPSDKPRGFLEALREKYVEPEDSAGGRPDHVPVYFNGKLAEEVGFDKVRRQLAELQELRVVIVDGAYLAGVTDKPLDPEEENLPPNLQDEIDLITRTCPNIRQLNLSRNLLESWADVVAICQALPNLTSLDLSRNRFRSLDAHSLGAQGAETAFERITVLALDAMLLSWAQITDLVKAFPNLQSLSLVSNQLYRILPGLSTKLTSITLADNQFTELELLAPLASLDGLVDLSLRGCPLSSLQLSPGITFAEVKSLDIRETRVSLESMASLPIYFPSLHHLRCPLPGANDPVFITAQIAELKTLNSSTVSPAARRDAELYYLSQIGKELSSAPESEELSIIAKHRRYKELCSLHGEPTIKRAETQSDIDSNTLEARFIWFSFFDHRRKEAGSRTSPDADPDFKLHLPMAWNLYRIYAAVAAHLNVMPAYLRLVWESEEWDPVSKEKRWPKIGAEASGDGGNVEYDEGFWSPSSEEEEEEGEDELKSVTTMHKSNKWTKREVKMEPGPREVGFWIEGRQARVRIENHEVDLSILDELQ